MALKRVETEGIVSALYREYDRIYFNNEMPKDIKILLHKMPKSDFKLRRRIDADGNLTDDYEYVLNGRFIINSNDSPEITDEKIRKLGESLRSLMVLIYHKEVLGYRPIMSKRFKDVVEKMNGSCPAI